MTSELDQTPFTETYFDTTLLRLINRLSPMIDMTRHQPTPGHSLLLDALGSEGAPLTTQERLWAGFTVVGQVIGRGDDQTEAELLFVAIITLRQTLLTGKPDAEGDTLMGQVFLMTLTIGFLAGRVLGDVAAEVMQLRGQVERSLRAKEGRSNHARSLNAERTAWHEAAKAKALKHRQTFPHRAATRIADVIHADPNIPTPSHEQVLATVRAWEKDGTIPKRRKQGEK